MRCIALLAVLASTATAQPPDVAKIDDFDDDVQNRLGGYRSPYAREPSHVRAMRVADVYRGGGGRSVRIRAQREPDAFCGYWIHLHDMRDHSPRFFDATRYSCLSFWVRGEEGGETFDVKLADRRWIEKEDALVLGGVEQLLPGGVTTEWQEVVVSLTGKLNWSELGGISFDFTGLGQQTIYLDDVSFKTSADLPVPETAATTASLNHTPQTRKLWVWSTARLLKDESAAQELFDLCREHRIDEIWTQLLYDIQARTTEPLQAAEVTLTDQTRWQHLIRSAHEHGIRVHALDGYPEFAVRSHHDIPLGVINAVIVYNRSVEQAARFDGVHFDNEPYLLPGWHDPALREGILAEFLELNAECQRRISTHSEMQYGIDIPFWWQERDDEGRVVGDVTFRGKRQAASYHCLELLDNVGVMNYRDAADGADGMIAHGRKLLDFADRQGRAVVYMGIETFRYRPTVVWFVPGPTRKQFVADLRGSARGFSRLSRVNGLRLRTLDDGQRVHIGVEVPEEGNTEAVTKTLLELAAAFNTLDAVDDATHQRLQRVVASDAQWHGLQLRDFADPTSGRSLKGFSINAEMLGKITFADEPFDEMMTQVRAAEDFFSRYQRYRGTAIHYYETFRAKAAPPVFPISGPAK